jgi:putative drug exporter of the RND superfamily
VEGTRNPAEAQVSTDQAGIAIGPGIQRWRWLVLAAWAVGAAGLGTLAGRANPAANEPESFLPDTSEYARATRVLREAFPLSSGLSEAVVVFERTDRGLTELDSRAVEALAAGIRRPAPPSVTEQDLAGVSVRSPASLVLPANPFRSRDGHAALILVNVPASFITVRSAHVVDHVRALAAAARLPEGLHVAVTGSSGYGHDYAQATLRSSERIGQVTIVAVILILLLVYRAPVAALIPLAAISVAAYVAMKVLTLAQHVGMHVGTGEKVFVFVLIYGAGVDYSMLFISRCREFRQAGADHARSVAGGLGATLPAILASAGTNTFGMLMLCFADYGVFRTAGPAVAISLVVALLASVTLVPAMVALAGRALFWPGRGAADHTVHRLWPAVARAATGRSGLVLALGAVLLAAPAVGGARLQWVYDTLADLKPAWDDRVGNAAAGLEVAHRHWPVGQIAPVTVLLRTENPLPAEQWQRIARRLTDEMMHVPDVQDVRSLAQPLGERVDIVSRGLLWAAAAKVRPEYLSADGRAMRALAVLGEPALSLSSMAAAGRLRQAGESLAAELHLPQGPCRVYLAGASAEMAAVRQTTHADFRRIAALVLGVIFLMVLALLRDVVLSAFLVAATVLSYLATLGLSAWALAAFGSAGLDWKVEVFLFVVMVAVGVDYSIFLAARVAQEARMVPLDQAVGRAVVHTGPVISSCGLIMAATLGSLMAGELKLFVQLGFALALGMLIDTFVVRPLVLPAFIAMAGRWRGKMKKE